MNNGKENYYKSLTGKARAVPIILGALAVFVTICFFTKDSGLLGKGIGMTLRGLFSYASFATPVLLAIHALLYAEDVAKKKVLSRTVFSVCALLAASAVEYAICFWAKEPVFTPGAFFADASSGGFVGCVIGFALMKLVGHIGVIVIAVAALAIYSIFFFADSTGEFGRRTQAFARGFKAFFGKMKESVDSSIEKKKAERAEREAEEHILKSDDLMNDPFFYENSGVEGLRVDNGNIHDPGKPSPAAPAPAEGEELERRGYGARRKKRADKHLDLDYGIDIKKETVPEETVPEAPTEAPAPTPAPFTASDSAESVFTKDFDPFDFATGEKIASRPSSRAVPIEEEIDELMPPPKKELSARDRRRADFEAKKNQWLENHSAAPVAPESSHAAETAPTFANESLAAAEHDLSATPSATPKAPEIPAAAVPSPATVPVTPGSVNAYTSYSSTQTTYTQPIKTVEFTVTATPKPSQAEPRVTDSVSRTYDKSTPNAESAEDIATVIAEKIAKANPAYARSANEMVTYTKITPSPAELEAERVLAEASIAEPEVLSFDNAENGAPTFEGDAAPAAEAESSMIFTFGDNDSEADTVVETVPEAIEEDIAAVATVEEIAPEVIEEDIAAVATVAETAPEAIEEDIAAVATVVETAPEAVEEDILSEEAEPVVRKDETDSVATTDAVTAHDGSKTRSAYERAAGFAAALDCYTVETVSEPEKAEDTPEFKQYTPPNVSDEPYEAFGENTLKVERDMIAPTLTANSVSEAAVATVATPIASTAEVVTTAAVATAAATIAGTAAATVANTQETDASDSVGSEEIPLCTVINEETAFDEDRESESPAEPLAQSDILWSSDDADKNEADTDDEPDVPVFFDDESEDILEGSEEDEEEFSENTVEAIEEDAEEITEIPPEEQNPAVIKMREMFPFLAPIGEAPTPTHTETAEPEAESVPEEEPPFDEPTLVRSEPTQVSLAVEPVKEEKKKPDYSDYKFPPIEILAKEEANTDVNIQAEIQENADRLIETLSSFNVTASIKGVDRGPRITRYEVVPAKGVKVSSILNLQDDIALNLAAGAIRMEAPIPGKSAVGIEIPNKKSSIVRLRDLLENEEFVNSKSKTFVCIGRDVAGQPVFGDIAKMPHLLIAGATGMGKSVCINAIMISILFKAKPDEVKFIMIDPKQVEFTMYNGIPHLLVPVVSDPKQAAGALMWAVEEMERRYNLLNPLCVRNIDAYNEKVSNDPSLGEVLSRIVIVIDEFADLMLQVKDPVENLVMRIAQKARAAGIYLIIGTQRPSVNVITGVIKANVPSRISCKVMSNVDSKTVLDSAGAEKLLDRGDMLYAPAGALKPHRVQGAFVADPEVEAIMNHLKQFGNGENYDSNVMEEIERAAQKCSKKGSGGGSDHDSDDDESYGDGILNDRQFLDAVEIAVNTRKISTSLIQRKLSIGYGKAAKFIDIMEDMGIVGEANGQRPREVLISPDEWREKLARTTYD